MVLIDLSQVMISNVMLQVGQHTDAIQPDLLRHMILNTIRSLKTKFGAEYGELIICADDRKYWRRDYFPPYKGNRKADREKSGIDWHALFDMLNVIKQEIKDNFPYRVVQVEGAEADDVIGSICMEYGQILNSDDKILILSGDKDFVQLQVYGNVTQYDPVRKKSLTAADPDNFREHLILAGDRGDGVPNMLSPDRCIVEGLRQKPLRETKIDELLKADFKTLPEEIQRNWMRNRMLIDLRAIPQSIQDTVLQEFNAQAGKSRTKIFSYLIQHKMKMLMESINEF